MTMAVLCIVRSGKSSLRWYRTSMQCMHPTHYFPLCIFTQIHNKQTDKKLKHLLHLIVLIYLVHYPASTFFRPAHTTLSSMQLNTTTHTNDAANVTHATMIIQRNIPRSPDVLVSIRSPSNFHKISIIIHINLVSASAILALALFSISSPWSKSTTCKLSLRFATRKL